MAKSALPKYIF